MHPYLTHVVRAAIRGRPAGMALVLACIYAQILDRPLDLTEVERLTPQCATWMTTLEKAGHVTIVVTLTPTTTVTLRIVRTADTHAIVTSTILGPNVVMAQRWRDHYPPTVPIDLSRTEDLCAEAS